MLGYITKISALLLIGPRLILLILTFQTVMSFFAGWLILGETHDPASYIFVIMVMGGIILAILNKRVSVESLRHLAAGVHIRDFDARDWLKIAMVSLIGPVLSVFLSFNALKRISLGITSAMLQLSSVLMLFLARIVFKEKIKAIAIVGTLLTVSGTVLLILT